MNVVRIYTNSTNETLRVDELHIDISVNIGEIVRHTLSQTMPIQQGKRILKTTLVNSTSSSYGPDRVVAGIEVSGDYSTIETISGDYTWAEKILGNGNSVQLNMSDLPGIGDTV